VVPERIGRPGRFVHAAGPAKAIELARRALTLMQFAGPDARACKDALAGGRALLRTTRRLARPGVLSALEKRHGAGARLRVGPVGKDAQNARAACCPQAVVEMRAIALAAGGRAETVGWAAGVGDLHVTAAGGRNRAFGERVGRGRPAKEVAAEMLAAGELTE